MSGRFFLYGITRAPRCQATPLAAAGIDNQPVQVLACGPLAAVVTPLAGTDAPPLPPPAAVAHAFDRVIRAAAQRAAILPVRYGCVIADFAFLRQRCSEFAAGLNRLDGRVEMGIRVLLPPPRTPATAAAATGHSAGGRAFLEARRRHYDADAAGAQQAGATAATIRTALAGLFACSTAEIHRAAQTSRLRRPVLSLHFLIARGDVSAFRRRFAHLSRNCDTELLLSGPWPPYNFAQLPGPSDATDVNPLVVPA